MALKILMGSGTTDFRQTMLVDVQQKLAANRQLTVYYVVPNHIKFDSEVDVLRRYARLNGRDDNQLYAQSQLQVYSLTRLAWRLLQEAAQVEPTLLDDAGLFILVSKILRQNAERLPIFARMQAKKGFVAALTKQLIELRTSQIGAEELLTVLERLQAERADLELLKVNFGQKLRDLAVVADDFNAALADHWLTKSEGLNYFAKVLPQLDLGQTAFYFDSFNGFTTSEWSVISQLVSKSAVTVSLLGQAQRLGQQVEGDIFYKPMTTAQRLIAIAQTAGVTYMIETGSMQRPLTDSLQKLLSVWESLASYQELPAAQAPEGLDFFVAENVVTELNEVARRIRMDLVKNPALRLRDILILARDLGPYSQHLPAVMQAYDLAYFIDNDVKMQNHPLVELITNLLSNHQQLFHYQNILAILKIGFVRPYQDDAPINDQDYYDVVAHLDNYLTAHQPSPRIWHNYQEPFVLFKLDYQNEECLTEVDRDINRRINILRRFLGDALDDFEDGLAQSNTIRQAATFLMTWLQKYHVDQAIIQQRDQFNELGNLMAAQQIEEVWQMFARTLDQMVLVAGDDVYQLNDFRDALLMGFSGASFAGIPNQLDQLTISEAGIVQSQHYQKLYFIGGSRQSLPAQLKNKAVINDAERLLVQPALAQQAQPRYLQDTAQQQMADEGLLFYGALMAAQKTVVFSYPLLDVNGGLNEISPYYQRLRHHFLLDLTTVKARPANSVALLLDYVGSPQATLSQLAKLPRVAQATTAFKAVRAAVANYVPSTDVNRILSAGQYRNQTTVLAPTLAAQLFHWPLDVSISQLETYYRDPFEYFLRYGLRLQERPVYELNAAQTGTLYHAILEGVVGHLIQHNQRLGNLDMATITQLVRTELAVQLQNPEFAILVDSPQGQAIQHDLAQSSIQLLQQLQAADRYNQSRPAMVEALFGFPQGRLAGLKYEEAGGLLQVRGKLDRFDRQDTKGQYGTIIDYKSNGKKFEWGQAYDGLQMQLLTYWQAGQANAKVLEVNQIGGAFFAPIKAEKTTFNKFKGNIDELLAGKLDNQTFKYRGLFIDDEAYRESLEILSPGESAHYYQLKVKGDGSLASNSEAVTPGQLELLLQHNQTKIEEAGRGIRAGRFPIRPGEASLQYSPYRDVIRFDRLLGDRYQDLSPTDKREILKRLEGEASDE